jgi:hypothetical protein
MEKPFRSLCRQPFLVNRADKREVKKETESLAVQSSAQKDAAEGSLTGSSIMSRTTQLALTNQM